MSSFLQLCQYTCRECRVAGGESALTAVTGQTGELQRIVSWVASCWTEIQNRYPDWRWMRAGFTVNTVSGDDQYAGTDCTDIITSAAIDRFGRWLIDNLDDPPKIYLSSAGVGTEGWLSYIDWDDFKSLYKIGTQNNAYPAHISVDPQNNLRPGPKPDAVYVVSGDYQRSAQILAANADIPEMPTQFHMLIVYEAMKRYGLHESAQEILMAGNAGADRLLPQLEFNQLPAIRMAGPLV